MEFEVDSNLFDIVVHFGTLIAVFIFFWREIVELVCGVFKKETHSTLFDMDLTRKEMLKIWGLLIVAIIPAGIVGLLLDDFLDEKFTNLGNIKFIILAVLFLITAVILFLTKFIKKENPVPLYKITFKQAIIVGISQAFAVLPGISRSGTTISAALVSGVDKKDAGRFSFLLSIPVIMAAFLLKILKLLISNEAMEQVNFPVLSISLIVSAVVGYFALKFLFKILSSSKFWTFSIYMFVPFFVCIFLYFFK